MKTLFLLFLISTLICTDCKKDSEIVKGFYDSLHFVRKGGGEIDFSMYPNESFYQINTLVSKFNFRDTTIQTTIFLDDGNMLLFSELKQAMNDQLQINGDFKQSSLDTGTWAYIYMVHDSKETEVTNTDLRNMLLTLEKIVREKI